MMEVNKNPLFGVFRGSSVWREGRMLCYNRGTRRYRNTKGHKGLIFLRVSSWPFVDQSLVGIPPFFVFRSSLCNAYEIRRNSSKSVRCFSVRVSGNWTVTLARRSPYWPALFLLKTGIPLPRKRKVRPFWVPAGIFKVT